MQLISAESFMRELAGRIGSDARDCRELLSLAKMCADARPERERPYLLKALMEELD